MPEVDPRFSKGIRPSKRRRQPYMLPNFPKAHKIKEHFGSSGAEYFSV